MHSHETADQGAVLCCAVLCCTALCCAVLCCAVLGWAGLGCAGLGCSAPPVQLQPLGALTSSISEQVDEQQQTGIDRSGKTENGDEA